MTGFNGRSTTSGGGGTTGFNAGGSTVIGGGTTGAGFRPTGQAGIVDRGSSTLGGNEGQFSS